MDCRYIGTVGGGFPSPAYLIWRMLTLSALSSRVNSIFERMAPSMGIDLPGEHCIQIHIRYEHGNMVSVSTNSPLIDHFLRKTKMSRSVHTWINYTHDLKVFFSTLCLPLERIDRKVCVQFIEHQDHLGLSRFTINRRLAFICKF